MAESEVEAGCDVGGASICVSFNFSLTFLPSLSLLLSLGAGDVGAAVVVCLVSRAEVPDAVASCGFSGMSVMV